MSHCAFGEGDEGDDGNYVDGILFNLTLWGTILGERLNYAQKLKRNWNCVQHKTGTSAITPHFWARIHHLNAPEIHKPVQRLWTLLSNRGNNFYEIVVSQATYHPDSNAWAPCQFCRKNMSRRYSSQAWITKVIKVPRTRVYVSSCSKVCKTHQVVMVAKLSKIIIFI